MAVAANSLWGSLGQLALALLCWFQLDPQLAAKDLCFGRCQWGGSMPQQCGMLFASDRDAGKLRGS